MSSAGALAKYKFINDHFLNESYFNQPHFLTLLHFSHSVQVYQPIQHFKQTTKKKNHVHYSPNMILALSTLVSTSFSSGVNQSFSNLFLIWKLNLYFVHAILI